LVDWYTTDDPQNPMNWSTRKKVFITGQIDLYTFAVYMASSIYTSGEQYVILSLMLKCRVADILKVD
jgi:DHA1 family multidrug resistance protein-like MFS transporter